MKLDFPWRADRRHDYCVEAGCHAETVARVSADGRELFHCRTCDRRNERRIVIDPAVHWWVAADGEYWHESAGVFLYNRRGEFLFFERRVSPYAWTVPAGHRDANETPRRAARRELWEEARWRASWAEHVATANIVGDSCRRGSDAHRWHAYRAFCDRPAGVRLSGEGKHARWLTLAEALAMDLTHPVRYIIERHRAELTRGLASPSR